MGMFDVVEFDAKDIKAVMDGTASRGLVFAILTSQTCGEACWHAVEDVCRCSCGGKNHGCLRVAGAAKPDRTSRIDGHLYKLVAVGRYNDLHASAELINQKAGWKAVDKPYLADNGGTCEPFWVQYRYTWRATDHGAPARVKSASASQRKWDELSGWKDERQCYVLWQRITMPERPKQLVIDTDTGLPKADQTPD